MHGGGPCENCGKPTNLRCGQCKVQYVCSRECQTKRWKTHKPDCLSLQRAKERVGGITLPPAPSGSPAVPLELHPIEIAELLASLTEGVRARHRLTIQRLDHCDETLPSADKVSYIVDYVEALDSTSEANARLSLPQRLALNNAYNLVFINTAEFLTDAEKKAVQREMERRRIGFYGKQLANPP